MFAVAEKITFRQMSRDSRPEFSADRSDRPRYSPLDDLP